MTEILKSVSVFKVQINLCLFCNEMCVFWALITRVMMNVSLMLMRHLLSLALDLSLFTIYYWRSPHALRRFTLFLHIWVKYVY